MFAKAKDKFGERHFDYKLFTTSALKIFTDALHGKPPIRRNQNYNPCNNIMLTQEINYMQLIAFLSFDGQLSSEFEHKFMRFAVRWITDGLFNHRYENTSKKFAIMVFYFLSFNKPELTSLIIDLTTKTNLQDFEHIFVQWAMGKNVLANGNLKLRTVV